MLQGEQQEKQRNALPDNLNDMNVSVEFIMSIQEVTKELQGLKARLREGRLNDQEKIEVKTQISRKELVLISLQKKLLEKEAVGIFMLISFL